MVTLRGIIIDTVGSFVKKTFIGKIKVKVGGGYGIEPIVKKQSVDV